MKALFFSCLLLLSSTMSYAIENPSNILTAKFDGAAISLCLKTELSTSKRKVDFNVYRYESGKKETLVFSLKDADNRAEWLYSDTSNLLDGIYVYRTELVIKGKILVNESVIVDRFKLEAFPSVSAFTVQGVAEDPKITLAWDTKNPGRIRNLLLERRNSLEEEFSLIAVLSSGDSSYVDSIVLANEAYFYRFQIQDRVTGQKFQSATVHFIPTFEIIPTTTSELAIRLDQTIPVLEWHHTDEKTRGFYVYKLDPQVGVYQQVSLLITPDSANTFRWFDNQANLKEGSTYTYYVVPESHSYTKGTNSNTVSIYIPAANIVLTPPAGLQLLKDNDSICYLVWEIDPTRIDEIGYFEIHRKKSNDSEFDTLNLVQVPYTQNFIRLNNLVDGEVFTVVSGNGTNKSNPSFPITFNSLFQTDFGPLYLKSEVINDELIVQWNLPEYKMVNGFKLYKWSGESYSLIATLKSGVNSTAVKNYEQGENNTYIITAIALDGTESSPSKPLTVF